MAAEHLYRTYIKKIMNNKNACLTMKNNLIRKYHTINISKSNSYQKNKNIEIKKNKDDIAK